jgi:hypothetical protein
MPGHDERLVEAELTLEYPDLRGRPLEEVHDEGGGRVQALTLDEVEAEHAGRSPPCLRLRHATQGTAVLGRPRDPLGQSSAFSSSRAITTRWIWLVPS